MIFFFAHSPTSCRNFEEIGRNWSVCPSIKTHLNLYLGFYKCSENYKNINTSQKRDTLSGVGVLAWQETKNSNVHFKLRSPLKKFTNFQQLPNGEVLQCVPFILN